MSHQRNIIRIKSVNNALGDLKDRFVFVGGATVSLYTDRMSEEVRPTDDVDVLVELWSGWDYAELEEKLRQIGFCNDTSAKFVGRYIVQGITVDLMPMSEGILGFSNTWYSKGFSSAINYKIDENHEVKILPVAYFIASKLEAFKNRGGGDGRTSSDFEDIIFILENRNAIWNDMKEADVSLNKYLKKEFAVLMRNSYFEEWVDAHVSFNPIPSTYFILEKLNEFILSK